MKIEIKYDPAAMHTTTSINGNVQEESDIYNFIFPVKDCPLQCWIYKNGSWKGIAKYLDDLARGNDLELSFYGRKIDFLDLKEELKRHVWQQELHLKLIEMELDYEKLSNQLTVIEDDLGRIDFKEKTGSDMISACQHLKEKSEQLESYKIEITNMKELFLRTPRKGYTYLIQQDAFITLEDLDKLERLVQTMQIPPDGIVCLFTELRKMRNYQSYAETRQLPFIFTISRDEYECIYKKYSMPVKMHEKYKIIHQIYKNTGKILSPEDISDRIIELQSSTMDDKAEQERERWIRYKKWVTRNQEAVREFRKSVETLENKMKCSSSWREKV